MEMGLENKSNALDSGKRERRFLIKKFRNKEHGFSDIVCKENLRHSVT